MEAHVLVELNPTDPTFLPPHSLPSYASSGSAVRIIAERQSIGIPLALTQSQLALSELWHWAGAEDLQMCFPAHL